VFRSVEGQLPRGDRWYEAGRSTLETAFLNAGREPDISEPEDMLEYFRRLCATGTLDQREIEALRRRQRFKAVCEGDPDDHRLGRYRLIEDDTFPAVIATWSASRETAERLLDKLRDAPTSR
jgi:hypothetical protein